MQCTPAHDQSPDNLQQRAAWKATHHCRYSAVRLAEVGLLLLVCLGRAAASAAPAAAHLLHNAHQKLGLVARPGHEALNLPASWYEARFMPGFKPRTADGATPSSQEDEAGGDSELGRRVLVPVTRLHKPPYEEGQAPAQDSMHSGRGINRDQRPQRRHDGPVDIMVGRKLLQAWDESWQLPGNFLSDTTVGQPFAGLPEGLPLLPNLDPPALVLDSLQGAAGPDSGPPLLAAAASFGTGWRPSRLGTLFDPPPLLWIDETASAPGPLPAPVLAPAPAPQPLGAALSSAEAGAPVVAAVQSAQLPPAPGQPQSVYASPYSNSSAWDWHSTLIGVTIAIGIMVGAISIGMVVTSVRLCSASGTAGYPSARAACPEGAAGGFEEEETRIPPKPAPILVQNPGARNVCFAVREEGAGAPEPIQDADMQEAAHAVKRTITEDA